MLDAGVPFHVKYLGSVLVEKSSGEDVTSDAIKTIILMVGRREKERVREMKGERERWEEGGGGERKKKQKLEFDRVLCPFPFSYA